MEQITPGPAGTGREGEEIGYDTDPNLVRLHQNRNTSDLARKKAYENLGLELARRGEVNVSQFAGTFVNLPENIQAELFKRLQDFTRLSIDVYEQAGAIRFPPRFIPIPGSKS